MLSSHTVESKSTTWGTSAKIVVFPVIQNQIRWYRELRPPKVENSGQYLSLPGQASSTSLDPPLPSRSFKSKLHFRHKHKLIAGSRPKQGPN